MNSKAIKNNTILLVDDEEGIRKVLKITLEASGHHVFLSPDGESGLNTFIQENPEIVITDIKMPGIDGIELLKRIKNLNPETEVIMITGHGDMDLAVKSLKYEAADFITKPIDIVDLESAIKKAQDRISITQNISRYMDDLENLVEEKDKKINESQQLVTIGQTIAGMSHAIKNIAGGLKGSTFVLEQGIDQENREYLKQGWEMMKGNIDKITKLSLDLLNYAKTTKLDFKLENPNTPAREIVQLMTHRAKEKNIVFKLTPCKRKKLVLIDCEAIHNCILNLVTNAFDSFDELLGSTRNKTVNLLVKIESNHIEYSVQDNGCGINDTLAISILNDFITTKGMNGTGFGLMTTKKIIQEHNGTINFITEMGKGSRFVIKIPLKTTRD
ncbi:MAG: response regulator [Desulfobacteraceae bacterium]|nr:response regulator [Desulfobacteraceae bacterium]